MLKDLFTEVVVCNTCWDLLKNIKGFILFIVGGGVGQYLH